MATTIQELTAELADNWPAFVYIAMTVGFSICYFRERRAEKEILRARFDRLEMLLQQSAEGRPPETLNS